jgi:hypothetical protein
MYAPVKPVRMSAILCKFYQVTLWCQVGERYHSKYLDVSQSENNNFAENGDRQQGPISHWQGYVPHFKLCGSNQPKHDTNDVHSYSAHRRVY